MKLTSAQLRQIIREEVKKSLSEEEEEHRIVCHGCGHQWDLSDGGNDPYTCHLCGQRATLMEAYSKGQLFAGNLKIDGQKVPVEVELLGANDKTKTFTAKVIHIDKKYYSKLPKDGILNIPARIFRVPGGGWRRIKTPSVF